MIEFASFCFLQNHKTGCTMVETFLRQHCSENIVRYEKHKAPKQRKDGKFYFISVREPLDTYLSLFNYGLDGKGELFARLSTTGVGDLYAHGIDGFGAWLDFVLNPTYAVLVYPKGCSGIAKQLGLASFRYLRLAALGFEEQCDSLDSAEAIIHYSASHRLVDRVIHYETIQQELIDLVKGTLNHAFIDLAGALAWLATSPRINTSNRREQSGMALLNGAQRARLVEREWYLYENYYAEMAGKLTYDNR